MKGIIERVKQMTNEELLKTDWHCINCHCAILDTGKCAQNYTNCQPKNDFFKSEIEKEKSKRGLNNSIDSMAVCYTPKDGLENELFDNVIKKKPDNCTADVEMAIPIDDFKIIKILISERFCNLDCGKIDNLQEYEIIKKLYNKYCNNNI